jgi:hypothetical protein
MHGTKIKIKKRRVIMFAALTKLSATGAKYARLLSGSVRLMQHLWKY